MKQHQRAARRVALFLLCIVPLACRQDETPPVTPQAISFAFNLSVGDSYAYDALLIDVFGYYLPSTKSRAVQRVIATGGTRDGFSGVTTMLDSTVLLRDSVGVVRTFLLARSAAGDLYRYGFVSELARLTRRPMPIATWDCIVSFSGGLGSSWLVGYLDDAQQEPVYATLGSEAETYVATVNGQQTLLSCYRVECTGDGIDYLFWVSDSPPAFLHYILVPGDSTQGAEFSLTDLQTTTN